MNALFHFFVFHKHVLEQSFSMFPAHLILLPSSTLVGPVKMRTEQHIMHYPQRHRKHHDI